MILYKLGLFRAGLGSTAFLDNKGSFQGGVNRRFRNVAFQLKAIFGARARHIGG